jgi:hypothetical protein
MPSIPRRDRHKHKHLEDLDCKDRDRLGFLNAWMRESGTEANHAGFRQIATLETTLHEERSNRMRFHIHYIAFSDRQLDLSWTLRDN